MVGDEGVMLTKLTVHSTRAGNVERGVEERGEGGRGRGSERCGRGREKW